MPPKFTMALGGAESLIRELKLLDPRVRQNTRVAVKENTEPIAQKTKSKIHSVSGDLASTVRTEYVNDGLTGLVKMGEGKLPRRSKAQTANGKKRARGRKRKIGKGAYGVVIDRGSPRQHIKAQHILTGPFDEQKPKAVADIDKALNAAVDKVR